MFKIKSDKGYIPSRFIPEDLHEGDEVYLAGRVIGTNKLDKFSYFFVNSNGDYARTKINSEQDSGDVRRGDLVELVGSIKVQKSGEKYIQIDQIIEITKNEGMLPNGDYFNSVHTNQAVQSMFSPESFDFFVRQGRTLKTLRESLDSEGFMEVMTPILMEGAYSNPAKDFVTYHGKSPFFLKKINEPRLKVMLISGFEKIYEIGKVFRNEGKGAQLIPEFTNLDAIMSYTNYEDVQGLAKKLFISSAAQFDIDIREIPVIDLRELSLEGTREEQVRTFKKVEAPRIKGAFIAQGYPSCLAPQAKIFDDDPSTTQEFRVFYNGKSFIHGYMFNEDYESPLQDGEKRICEDFEKALQYKMPPSGGIGLGIEKMIQLLSGKKTVKDTLFFRK